MICINDLKVSDADYELYSVQDAISRRGGRIDRTTEDYIYHMDGYDIMIPKGFKWDGASIPRALWGIIGGPFGRYSFAALVHDFCYASRCVPREVADAIFYKILKEHGVSRTKSWFMYKAVRIGGSSAYNKTDERPAINRLLRGSKWNPYGAYRSTLWNKFHHDELILTDDMPWIKMNDKDFEKAYTALMLDKWHM